LISGISTLDSTRGGSCQTVGHNHVGEGREAWRIIMLGLGWKHLMMRIKELEKALQAIVDTEDPNGYAVWKAKKALES